MKKANFFIGGLIGISVLILSGSNALSGVRQDVDQNIADIADIKAQIGDLPGLKKRVEALEETAARHEGDIKANKDDIAQNKDEIEALKKRLDDLRIPEPQLACVTGMFIGGSMNAPEITNQMNISISDPFEVFTTYDNPGADDHPWGLFCNDGWINTGCSQRNDGDIETTNDDLDVQQDNNGCSSDNDEYGELWLYTTCCKIIGN
ncbi:MAG: coiled-coil domain-containing protein [Candidatus Electrothrix sp. YB6]